MIGMRKLYIIQYMSRIVTSKKGKPNETKPVRMNFPGLYFKESIGVS